MDTDLFITVPITQGFNPGKIIGSMQILKSELPDTPNFLFAIGYKALELECMKNTIPSTPYSGKYELAEASIVYDTEYLKYLKQINVL